MPEVIKLTWSDVLERAEGVSRALCRDFSGRSMLDVYPIPRGGIPAAQAVQTGMLKRQHPIHLSLVEDREKADIYIDDLIDSGATAKQFGDKPLYVLLDKQKEGSAWREFPWERMANEQGPQENVRRLIEFIGDDPNREGLKETPARVIRSYGELFGGYKQKPEDAIKVFEDEKCDEMVLIRDVEFVSTCVVGSTFVETPKGRIPISRLEHGEFVYCWDEDHCRMTIGRAFNPRITGRNKKLWRVYSDKDTVLCTGDHKFLTQKSGWVEARDLNPGDSMVALNRGSIECGGSARSRIVWTGLSKQIAEHQFIYKEINGEYEGHIHHIDGKPNNNAPENLTVIGRSGHSRLHRLKDGPTGFALFTDEQRRAMRKRQIEGIRASQTEETRRKRSASVKAYWDSLSSEERAVRNHRILMVEETDWREDVWCVDVPGYENFVANGMVVHNCEHHMLPFFGKAHIAYIPDGKVIGVSKLVRLLEVFSRRLQIQERLCEQVTAALDKFLEPLGSACILEAKHLCMTGRGVRKQGSVMVTSSLTGVFREAGNQARQELLGMIR